MHSISKKIFAAAVLASLLTFSVTGVSSAHVTVKPGEVVTAGFQTFTVGAPNEKAVAFNSVKLLLPASLKHVSVTNKPGWQVDIQKEGTGEEATVTAITWSGSSVPSGFREEFTFNAQVPAEASELQWKAYQTYADGLTVSWDLSADQQPKNQDGSPDFSKSGPFSVTKVVAETESAAALKKAEQTAADAKKNAQTARTFGFSGIALGLVGIAIATKKQKK